MAKVELDRLNKLVEDGLLTTQKHPVADLYIFNYSVKAQYLRHWDEYTIMCRGLITDKEGNIVARPFKKFFNIEEHTEPMPDEPFEITDKMDGSLGILFFIDDIPHIATRGSFSSEQAKKAISILRNKYSDIKFDKNISYLFEIIYPENRIVVNYGDKEDLVLLAMLDTETGNDLELKDIGLPLVKKYDAVNDLNKLREIYENNGEGFVVRFKSGLRVKLKFAEYVRLHRIITQITARDIWEKLRDNQSLEPLLEKVPDEFFNWVDKTVLGLKNEYKKIEEKAKSEFKIVGDRKENAEYFKSCTYPAVMFKLLDNRDYSEIIWKMIKPKADKPFREEIE